jgi:hypothetical protein
MRKLMLAALLLCSTIALAIPPALTTVTATIQDSSFQVWSQATWTTTFIPPFGNPSPPNNRGNSITPNQSSVANTSGFFTVNLDDNNVVAPAGSKWKFTICPNASVTSCTEIQLIITGPAMDISAAINSAIQVPVVSAVPSIARAYNDTEANGSFGVLYSNTIDNTLRQCQLLFCQGSGWIIITVPVNNPVFTGTLTVPCVKFNFDLINDTTVCSQAGTGHIAVTLPAIAGVLAELNSPIFTGNPQAPTPLTGDNSTSIATTAFVKGQNYVTAVTAPVTSVFGRTGAIVATGGDYIVSQVTGAAPLASPTFTGDPKAPTAAPGDNDTSIATTAFVQAAVGSNSAILAHSVTTCSLCPVAYSNASTTIISHAVTFPSSGCPCRIFARYIFYLTTANSGTDASMVSDGTNTWAGGNNETTGAVGSGSTYPLEGSGFSPTTYANNANVTFTILSANSHSGGTTANANCCSSVTGITPPASNLTLDVVPSQ